MRAVRCAVVLWAVAPMGSAISAGPPVAKASVPAAAEHVDDLSSLLSAAVEKYKLPGMAAAIVEGNRVTAIGAAGVRCRGEAARITINDQFHIGSDTKSMTATVAAMLVEEGKLSWMSSPADILPKDGVSPIDPAWKKVTLEELLTHHAGVRPNPDIVGLLFIRAFSDSAQKERRTACRSLLKKPPDHEPAKDFLYSNAGFIIAGTMAETVAGKPWEDLMRERLFGPLGMSSAGYGPPGTPSAPLANTKGPKSPGPPTSAAPTEPCGHMENGTSMPPSWASDNPACFGPAGTVHVSLGDWAKYASLHLAGERGTPFIPPGASKPLLSVESVRRLHAGFGKPINKNGVFYAMGWGVAKDPKTGEKILTHYGSNGFWLAGIVLYPARNTAILVATNQGGQQAQLGCSQVMRTLAGRKPQR